MLGEGLFYRSSLSLRGGYRRKKFKNLNLRRFKPTDVLNQYTGEGLGYYVDVEASSTEVMDSSCTVDMGLIIEQEVLQAFTESQVEVFFYWNLHQD